MSKYRVLYIDDEKDDLTQPIKKKLEAKGSLEIILNKPENFEDQIDKLQTELDGCVALILDLQLNGPQEDVTNEAGDVFQVKYQAPPLAQMIRTYATEGKLPDIPIILCSTEDKIQISFSRDFTSHDLFDWTFLKDDIDDETIEKIVSLIKGYQNIGKNIKDFDKFLDRNYSEIDERILSRFVTEENPPVHEIARVIFKDIVQPTGVLINELTLAARLGVDIKESGENWNKLIDHFFYTASYKGVYHESWIRWWNDKVLDVFENITNENLASLDAIARVALLVEKTGINGLIAANPIELFESSIFWNICEVTKMPLDPFEGFKISGKEEPKPWQDYSYVSLFAVVSEPDLISKKGIKIHPTDNERLIAARKKID
ncbi:hypothetical protein [uncultured Draconibacterium sp.]|uniref:hypothetical protein n=1 Tax=uncultured Draconibacterium sp. TaxID=1573823 RepID=UPI002AA6886A|nr:hypothetical protein [uncultured Draconibacterium sp.]